MKNSDNTTRYKEDPKSLSKSPQPTTIGEWILWVADKIQKAEICLENGTQEPYLEAEHLISYEFSIAFNEIEKMADQPAPPDAANRVALILDKRIKERLPASYITHEAFFAGRPFFVDNRVLIPRSRVENIFDDEVGFDGLMAGRPPSRILDLGTGSGCLAITLALTYPEAAVDASDISPQALEVAEINQKRFNLENRVALVESDLFSALAQRKYDLIVTNPPYVSAKTMNQLPPEYRHEPALALAAGHEGLDLIMPLLQQAANYLNPDGLLVCEVGDETQEVMEQCWPEFPGQWLLFHFGGSGLFVITREQLVAWNELEEDLIVNFT